MEVMVIDDDISIYDIQKHLLKKIEKDFNVEINLNYQSSALSAVDHIEKNGFPELILCDYKMPWMSGIAMYKWLKSKNFNGAFYLVSSADRANIKEEMVREHIDNMNFIDKPIYTDKIDQLQEAVAMAQ